MKVEIYTTTDKAKVASAYFYRRTSFSQAIYMGREIRKISKYTLKNSFNLLWMCNMISFNYNQEKLNCARRIFYQFTCYFNVSISRPYSKAICYRS